MFLSDILNNMIVCWQKIDTKPHGILHNIKKNNIEVVDIQSSFKRPLSFNEFIKNYLKNNTEKLKTKDLQIMFKWFTRMKLRFSCSYLSLNLYKYLLPKLKKLKTPYGIINDIKIYVIKFIPKNRNSINFCYNNNKKNNEFIENEYCIHNILISSNGIIIDISGGQFTGNIKPQIYKNKQSYFNYISTNFGKIEDFRLCSEMEIKFQIQIDNRLSIINKKYKHKIYSKSVLKMNKNYCNNCYTNHILLSKCSKCKKVYYCSVYCQKLDWKEHKKICK
tara:strand:- start:426 stop:1256 length:831 start_codon:yes stop_codon:yes gene_type:complete